MRCGCARHFQRRHKTNKNQNINTELIILKGPFRRGWKNASSEAQGHSAHPYFCFLSSFTHKDWFSFRVFELVSVALSFPPDKREPAHCTTKQSPGPKEGGGLIRGSALKSWPGLPPPPSPDPSTSTSPCYHHIRSRGWNSSVVCTSHLKHGEFINDATFLK